VKPKIPVIPFIAVAATALWLGLAEWAQRAPQSLAWAFTVIGGICGGLAAALAVLSLYGPPGRRRRPRWPSWAPPRTADRPTAALDGHPIPPVQAWRYDIPEPEAAAAGPPWGPAPRPATDRPPSWGAYPAPHTDEDDTCQCPDHAALRGIRNWT